MPPVNGYLLGNGVRLPRNIRFSGGIDQAISPLLSVGTYAHVRGTSLQRGLNLNPAVNGISPDPAFVNVVEVTSDARSQLDTISVNVDGGLAPPSLPFLANSAPLVDWKRVRFFGNYTLGGLRNNTDGAFSLAPGVTLDREWGYGPQDVRHRLNFGLNHQIVRNLTSNINVNASSGTPYTLRTGVDDNGDVAFNDRPAGVDRNTERAAAQWAVNLGASHAIPVGKRTTPPPPGFLISVVGGQAPTVQQVTTDWRYRIQFFVQVQNLTNRANYIGYSGVLTSPFFGRPTSVANPRKVDIGLNFSF